MKVKDLIPWAKREDMPRPAGGEDNPVTALQREMNQLFESFWKRLGSSGLGELDLPWSHSEARSDMVQTEDAVEITIELPGMELADIEVSVTDDMLTVKGEKKVERKDEKKGYYLSERSYGAIYRSIPLPPGVEGAKAEASFKNGVLTIRLPQTAEAKATMRQIEVKAA